MPGQWQYTRPLPMGLINGNGEIFVYDTSTYPIVEYKRNAFCISIYLLFQMYISLVGPKYTEITKSANIILQKYYMAQRKSQHRDPSRTTVRMLDSLVR